MARLEKRLSNIRENQLKKTIEFYDDNTDEYKTKARYKARQKAIVILLKFKSKSNPDGKSIKDVISETKLSKRTILNYIKGYTSNELLFIHKNNYKKSSLLSVNGLIEEFQTRKPQSYMEAKERIKVLYGIDISLSAVRVYLNKHGIQTKSSRNDYQIKNNQ